jgi:hypothetical protein
VAGSNSLDETEAYFHHLEDYNLPAEAEDILKHQADLAIQQGDFFGSFFALNVASLCRSLDPELTLRLLVFWVQSSHPNVRCKGAHFFQRLARSDPVRFVDVLEKAFPVLFQPENSGNKKLIFVFLCLGSKGLKRLRHEIRGQVLMTLGGYFGQKRFEDLRGGFRVLGKSIFRLADIHFGLPGQLPLPAVLTKELESAQVFMTAGGKLKRVFSSLPSSWDLLGQLPKDVRRRCIANFIQNATVFSLQQFALSRPTHKSTVRAVLGLLEADDLENRAVTGAAKRFFKISTWIDPEGALVPLKSIYGRFPMSFSTLKAVHESIGDRGWSYQGAWEAPRLVSQAIFDAFGMGSHDDLPDAHHCLSEGLITLKALKQWSQKTNDAPLISFFRLYCRIIKMAQSVLEYPAMQPESVRAFVSDLTAIARISPDLYAHVSLWKIAQTLFLDPEVTPADFSQTVTRLLASGDLAIAFLYPYSTDQA